MKNYKWELPSPDGFAADSPRIIPRGLSFSTWSSKGLAQECRHLRRLHMGLEHAYTMGVSDTTKVADNAHQWRDEGRQGDHMVRCFRRGRPFVGGSTGCSKDRSLRCCWTMPRTRREQRQRHRANGLKRRSAKAMKKQIVKMTKRP